MPPEVFFAVLAAAALHAAWNGLLKSGGDPYRAAAWAAFGAGAVSLPLGLWLGPPAVPSLPYVACSGVIHVGYFLLLGRAYRVADLSVAYPLMRGGAPLATAILAALWLDEPLRATGWVAVALISGGVASLGGHALVSKGLSGRSAAMVAAMVAIIVAYTLCDGVGARLSEAPASYVLWTNVLTAVLLAPVYAAAAVRTATRSRLPVGRLAPGRGFAGWRRDAARGLVAGSLLTVSYGTALWAMTRAPIGMVAALRETSVLFGMLIGVGLLKEALSPARIGAGIVIVAALVMLRTA